MPLECPVFQSGRQIKTESLSHSALSRASISQRQWCAAGRLQFSDLSVERLVVSRDASESEDGHNPANQLGRRVASPAMAGGLVS